MSVKLIWNINKFTKVYLVQPTSAVYMQLFRLANGWLLRMSIHLRLRTDHLSFILDRAIVASIVTDRQWNSRSVLPLFRFFRQVHSVPYPAETEITLRYLLQ